jgi:hypothetical protein
MCYCCKERCVRITMIVVSLLVVVSLHFNSAGKDFSYSPSKYEKHCEEILCLWRNTKALECMQI